MNVVQKDQTQRSKMILLLGLLSFLRIEAVQCLEGDGGFTFEGDLRHFAVASNMVYVSTEEKLYQLSHDLRLVRSLTQRGVLKDGAFQRVSGATPRDATFSVHLLLPFVQNDTLFTCGVSGNNCGYCEVLDLKDISNLVYREHILVGPLRRSGASVGFLVDVEKDSAPTETYILTAIEKRGGETGDKCSDTETINLHNSQHSQEGGIFSLTAGSETPLIRSSGPVEFVDGFQTSSTVFLLSNVRSGDQNNKVRLVWLESKTNKAQTVKSLRAADLRVSGGGEGSRLLDSSLIPGGPPVLWSGVFSVDGGRTDTQLLLFDISPDLSREPDTDPDFFYSYRRRKQVEVGHCQPA